MLHELRVENLLLMERAELCLAPGLNVLTGETGAGKSLLASALDLLLGGRAGPGAVRAGAPEAYVEGVFALPDWLREDERIPAGADELVLARRVWPDGRTRAYLCGRAATVADLRELGGRLLAFYGQHEHRKLMLTAAQLDVLDAWIGGEQPLLRQRMREAHERVREVEARLQELSGAEGARERELDLIAFELREIDEIAPERDEPERLAAERDRLRHAEALRLAAAVAAEALVPEDGLGASALVARAAGETEAVAGFDPVLGALGERLTSLRYELEDVAGELRSYLEGFEEAGPAELERVEVRLAALTRLARKHGGTIEEVLAHAERSRARQAELLGSGVTLDALSAELSEAVGERDRVAAELRTVREAAAPEFAAAVRERLSELAMAEASFEVSLCEREGGCGARGCDSVEFLLAANPGMPPAPLRDTASGGEMSRVMLAILSLAHGAGTAGGADDEPLLVFDEIDAGIGGHTARAVGAHLRALAEGRQVLCITHLPQVAALAGRHFTIVKDVSVAPAVTRVEALDGDGVLGELVRMLGADSGDRAARGHARELLKAA